MKSWLWIGLAVALGIVTGVGAGLLRVRLIPWDPADIQRPAAATPAANIARPQAVVDQADYDFKTMDVDVPGSHDFVVTNRGNAPLELTEGGTSCSCTLSELKQRVVAPGEVVKVTVQWKSKGQWGPYRQSATILTNDPVNPRLELTISGRLTAVVEVSPPSFELGRISSGDPAMAEARIYCNAAVPLKITGHRWLNPSTEGMFEFHYQPLTAPQLGEEADARSGFLAKIVVKPGLPLGPIRQTISLSTNLDTRPMVAIPIEGTIVSDISIVGRGWNADTGVLTLGTVSGPEGVVQTLTLITRGPYRKEVKFKAGQIVPDLLRIKFGPTTPLAGGAVYCTPVMIQIPKGSRPAIHLGAKQSKYGEITIETSHPRARQLHLYVSFAVTG